MVPLPELSIWYKVAIYSLALVTLFMRDMCVDLMHFSMVDVHRRAR